MAKSKKQKARLRAKRRIKNENSFIVDIKKSREYKKRKLDLEVRRELREERERREIEAMSRVGRVKQRVRKGGVVIAAWLALGAV